MNEAACNAQLPWYDLVMRNRASSLRGHFDDIASSAT